MFWEIDTGQTHTRRACHLTGRPGLDRIQIEIWNCRSLNCGFLLEAPPWPLNIRPGSRQPTLTPRATLVQSAGEVCVGPLTPNITLRGFVGYDNLSTDGAFVEDYDKLDAGAGLNLTVRF